MKRHEVLAALAAAAGLTPASPAQAGIGSGMALNAKPFSESLVSLQQQIGDNSEAALSQMIQLAKAQGHERGGNANGHGNSTSGQGKGIGGGVGGGRGHENTHSHGGNGHGHGHGQHHPS